MINIKESRKCEAALARIAAEDQGYGWETAAAQVARTELH